MNPAEVQLTAHYELGRFVIRSLHAVYVHGATWVSSIAYKDANTQKKPPKVTGDREVLSLVTPGTAVPFD